MQYLFENPIPLLMVGAVLLTFVGVLYYTTRSTPAFVGIVVVGALLLSLVVLEQLVYTPREQIEVSLHGITDAAEANDLAGVLSFLAPTAAETRALAQKLMPELDIQKANIVGEIEIALDDEKNPAHATVKFRGFFHARHKSGMTGGRPFPVEVELVRDGHRWLIESFRTEDGFEEQAARLAK